MRHINKLRATILTNVFGKLEKGKEKGRCEFDMNSLHSHLLKDGVPTYIDKVFCKNVDCQKHRKIYVVNRSRFELSQDYYEHNLDSLPIAIQSNLPTELRCRSCDAVGDLERTICQNIFIEVSTYFHFIHH